MTTNVYAMADLPGADFFSADLDGAIFTDANLPGANFYRASLIRADFSFAKLPRARFNKAHLVDADLTETDLNDADLTDANLNGAKLIGADLTDANLTDANLTDARLNGVVGLRWGQVGPIGFGRRLLTGWAHPSLEEVMIGGGCYLGTLSDFRFVVMDEEHLPWGWRSAQRANVRRWRAECLTAAALIELACAQ